jgi:hypothetical protein
LEKCARGYDWTVMPEYPISRTGRNPAKVDAAVLDAFNIPRGYWEAKDGKDDLKAEIARNSGARRHRGFSDHAGFRRFKDQRC